jgi:hypothetical protein
MDGYLTWGALILASGSIVGLIKFWSDAGGHRARSELAFKTAEKVRDDLAHYREEAAIKFASSIELAESERRLAAAVEGLRADFRETSGRIDGLLKLLFERVPGHTSP